MKTKNYLPTSIVYSFILLWGSALYSKLSHPAQWRTELSMQLFSEEIASLLWWLLPALHGALILLLLYRPWVHLGMICSTLLLLIYTLYLISGVTKVFGNTPCACGGIWPSNNHWIHIASNAVFIALGIYYWILAHRSRAAGDVPRHVGRKEGIVGT